MKSVLFLMLSLVGCGFGVVDTGHRGIKTRFGEVEGQPLPEGLYFYNPFTTSLKKLNVQEQKLEDKAECYTKDTQKVVIHYAVNFYPDAGKIGDMYKQFGVSWQDKIVHPVIPQAIKDVIGQYIADDLVHKREQARIDAFTMLKNMLASRNVFVTNLSFMNLDFDDAYEKAVESKMVAIQKAAEAKNKTTEVEEMARQTIVKAEAEAKSMSIRSQALSQNAKLVEWEAVQKWDGKLPQYQFGGATPFINVSQPK
jgi:regulator of protease activity HflC (stomatin/prohibitin superfamily)